MTLIQDLCWLDSNRVIAATASGSFFALARNPTEAPVPLPMSVLVSKANPPFVCAHSSLLVVCHMGALMPHPVGIPSGLRSLNPSVHTAQESKIS